MPENPKWPGAQGPQYPSDPGDPYASTVVAQPGTFQTTPQGSGGVAPTMAVPAMSLPQGFPPAPQGGSYQGQPPPGGSFQGQPPYGGPQPPYGGQPGGFPGAPQPPFGSFQGQPGYGAPQQPGFPSMQGGFPGQQPGYGAPQQPGYGNAPWGSAPQNPYPAPNYAPAPARSSGPMAAVGAVVALVGVMAVGGAVTFAKRGVRRAVNNATTPGLTATPRMNAINDPVEQTASKLDPYIENCLNRFSRQVFSAQDRYLQWCDENVGPTGRERNVYGIFQVTGETSQCAAAVQRAAAMQPSLPAIEQAANNYVVALNGVVPTINQAYTYYQRQNYRDDGFAQGRQLHGPLIVSLRQFTAAHRALSDAVNQVQDQNNDVLLARIQNDPSRRMEYLIKTALRTAKRLMRIGREARVMRDGTLFMAPGQDAAFIQLATEYEQNVDAMQAYATTNPAQAGRVRMLSSYTNDSNTYLNSVKNMARRLRDRTPFDSGERYRIFNMSFARHVQGTPDNVLEEYNDLVRSYNFIRY